MGGFDFWIYLASFKMKKREKSATKMKPKFEYIIM